MVLAAGMGTRLKPYTDAMPKALVPLAGQPMVHYIFRRLMTTGIKDVVVNVHHHSPLMLDYLRGDPVDGLSILISDESGNLRDTGGALKQAADLLRGSGHILVHNADVITDLDLNSLIESHINSNALATLAVRKRESSRYLLVDGDEHLTGWHNTTTGEYLWVRGSVAPHHRMAFSGVYILSERVLDMLPEREKFGIIPFLLDMAASHKVMTHAHDYGVWTDLGRPDDLQSMDRWLSGVEGKHWTDKYLAGWSPSLPV